MAPIRVALIGLSASAKTSWAAEGHLPYLLSSRGKERYEVTALLNSSVKAAEAAISHFNLPASVKAYGSPEDVANDPDIDLVVCNTRVDVHAPVTAPSIRAGKPVFIEWPLAENEKVARELVSLYGGNSGGSLGPARKSIIGFQGRLSPVVLKIKEILKSGTIGTVLSSDIHAFANLTPAAAYPRGLEYFADRAIGGNPATIAYVHMIDFVHDTLGQFVGDSKDFLARLQLQRPEVSVLGDGGSVVGTVTSDVPDLISVTGALEAGSSSAEGGVKTAPGATLTVSFRQGPAFPGTPNMVWTINGTAGELRITSPEGPFLHSDSLAGEPIIIELHDRASGAVSQIPWDWSDWQKELPVRARIVAMLYERYAHAAADWAETDKLRDSVTAQLPEDVRWPTLEDGVYRHDEIAAMFAKWDNQLAGNA